MKKYQEFLQTVRDEVETAALTRAEDYYFILTQITEIFDIGFVLLKDRLDKKK